MIYISLDPSTNSTGYAIFKDENLIKYGVWKPDKDLEWRAKINWISLQLHNLINTLKENGAEVTLIAECPIKTIKNVLTLEKLFSLHGSIMSIANINQITFIPVEVSGWRKQLGILLNIPKEENNRKVLKERSVEMANEIYNLDLKKSEDDISDAILIATTIIREVIAYGE